LPLISPKTILIKQCTVHCYYIATKIDACSTGSTVCSNGRSYKGAQNMLMCNAGGLQVHLCLFYSKYKEICQSAD